jgi:hypothetical protein
MSPVSRPISTLLAALAFLPALQAQASLVRINEVDVNGGPSNSHEFVELFLEEGGSLDDHVLVLYDGGLDVEYDTFELDGQVVPEDGFFVLGDAEVTGVDLVPSAFTSMANGIRNGPDALALYLDTTGLLTAADFAGTAVDTPPVGAELVDALVYVTGDLADVELLLALTPGKPVVDESSTSGDPTIDSMQRLVDGGVAFETRFHLVAPPTPGATNTGLGRVRINEVDAQQGSNNNEFVELYLPGGGALDRYHLVFYDGGPDAAYLELDLAGQAVPVDGRFVVGDAGVDEIDWTPTPFTGAANAIKNGADAVALYFDASLGGTLTSADFTGTPVTAPPADALLVDAIVHDTDDADDLELLAALTPGQPQANEVPDQQNLSSWALQRLPEGGRAFDTRRYRAGPRTPGGDGLDVLTARINEFVPGTGSTIDGDEYFEIWSDAGATLDDHYVVAYNGTDVAVARWSLNGAVVGFTRTYVRGDGHQVAVDSSAGFEPFESDIPNQGALALYYDASGELGGNDFLGTPVTAPPAGALLVDAVVYAKTTPDPELKAALTPDSPAIVHPDLHHPRTVQRSVDGGARFDTGSSVVTLLTLGRANLHLLRLNEYDVATGDPDLTFVEISAPPETPLAGYFLLLLGVDDSDILDVTDLAPSASSDVPNNGLLVVGTTSGPAVDLDAWPSGMPAGVQAAVLLYDRTFEQTENDFVDPGPGGGWQWPSNTHVIDAISTSPGVTSDLDTWTNDYYDLGLGTLSTVDEDAAGLAADHSLQRRPDGGAPMESSLLVVDRPTPGQPNTTPWVDEGHGLAGAGGVPRLDGYGQLGDGLVIDVALTNALPNSSAWMVIGLSQLLLPLKGGVLVPSPDVVLEGLPTDGDGRLVITTPWPAGLSGFTVSIQCWVVDAAGPVGVSASNGISGLTP